MFSCHQLSKHFGALAAVNSLSFELAAGEVLGIGGPNGAGKTTFFDLASGLESPTSGSVFFNGENITNQSPEQICHRGIARTFQLNAGFDSLSVRENVLIAAYFGIGNRMLPGLRVGAEASRRADEALEIVGLENQQAVTVENLPVFDRKLLMLAGAIATSPRLLLLDEPVGGLTPNEMEKIIEVVRAICSQGVSVILIEHVMKFLITLSSRVLIMHHGEKIYEGSADGLVKDQTVVDVYLGEGASQRLSRQMQSTSESGQ